MVTFGVSTKSYQTATLNMVTLFFMIMTAFIEIIMPHLISTSYCVSPFVFEMNDCFPGSDATKKDRCIGYACNLYNGLRCVRGGGVSN